VFSEPVISEMSQIELLSAAKGRVRLGVVVDPRDVHALVAPTGNLPAGAYRVAWRIVSADGHPVDGNFVFHIGAGGVAASAESAPPPEADSMMAEEASGPMIAGAPLIPALLRGGGMAAIMALTGLLMLSIGPRSKIVPPTRADRVATWLAVAAPILLAAHLAMWLVHAAPADQMSQTWLQSAMGTTVARMEAVRVGLALLAFWGLVLARRPGAALFFGGACLVVSGAIGHPAAISPTIAIPSKAVHLLALAVWLGGLLWLIVADRSDEASFLREARRVSTFALWAVIAVTLSGVLQSVLFLGDLSLLSKSAYGAFVLAKITGLALLVSFGAYHRFKLIPAIAAGAPSESFRASVRRETVLLIAVIFIGGFMAYVPTPHPPSNQNTISGDP
jgi:copper transport protein